MSISNPLAIGKLDHVGVVVQDVEEAIEQYVTKWGYTVVHREEVDGGAIELVFLEAGEMCVELVVPRQEGTPIAQFLEKRGPGLHHIAVRVEDIDGALKTLAERGVRLLDEKARPGGRGARIAFVHPSEGIGVLWELVEYADNVV